ncbi:NADPH-dependent assimilatory sulfite reductase hemoprotein subunit [Gemmata sp. JC717]|uniref:NADPH-dependent assimilatory sulfite reductase hemoprotein subunit n=1 Tax=Gemmata algarum TaxID=2975278 RepID=UPI0021BB2584|nr:NADPH-dependent assimilatory sulfite reductase hemoprotein subunit [Gemmata algarum]MDY3551685.1 NADPH-dependent assimilatory sulfite reductase hemoprotein subunit [Gemmata algarum]
MTTETEPAPPASVSPKLSAVEGIKAGSKYLRGDLAEQLAADTDHLSEDGKQLIKFHGSYQQEDRDARKYRQKAGVGKAYMFMIRLKLPGGKLTADQYLAIDDLAARYGNGTLRLTTRQSIQLHGVLKGDLKATIAGINEALLSTLGGCGDVNRNVVCCPAPTGDPVRTQMQALADAVAAHLAPHAGRQAYHELWLNGEKVPDPVAVPVEEAEPVYGAVYLPRKFKTAFALPEDNCTDLLAHCLGFQAVVEGGQPVGYNLFAGGGQGQTNSKPDTYPLLARPVCRVDPDEVVAAAEAVVRLFRDHGNRADRKRARLKYVLHDWGVERFRQVFARDYWKRPLRSPVERPITGADLHHGWHRQRDGKWFLGLSVENGRVKDEGAVRLRSGLRAIVSRVRCTVRLSAQQDALIGDIAAGDRSAVDALLSEYGVPRPETLPMVRKWSMACPAIPTCGLALTESERALPGVVTQLEAALARLGLAGEPISVRMTGCPNGCARPFQSEVGLVGRGGTKYTLYVGGDVFGRRLNFELEDSVPIERIVPKLAALFAAFKGERSPGETFGDYCARTDVERLRQLAGAGG